MGTVKALTSCRLECLQDVGVINRDLSIPDRVTPTADGRPPPAASYFLRCALSRLEACGSIRASVVHASGKPLPPPTLPARGRCAPSFRAVNLSSATLRGALPSAALPVLRTFQAKKAWRRE